MEKPALSIQRAVGPQNAKDLGFRVVQGPFLTWSFSEEGQVARHPGGIIVWEYE